MEPHVWLGLSVIFLGSSLLELLKVKLKRDPSNEDPLENGSSTVNLRPSLPIKITGYRLLSVTVSAVFVVAKVIMTQQGRSPANILDWVLAGVMGIMQVRYLYQTTRLSHPFLSFSLLCAGWFEAVEPPIWPWFFHTDYACSLPPIIYEGRLLRLFAPCIC